MISSDRRSKNGVDSADDTISILVTGSSGYLGQHLISSLCCNGLAGASSARFSITAAFGSLPTFKDDALEQFAMLHPTIASFMPIGDVDMSDANSVTSLVKKCDPTILVHLAANSSPASCEVDPDAAMAINCPLHLLSALSPHAKIIFLSTDQVYDGLNAPYKETGTTAPVNVYGRSKLSFEKALLTNADRKDDSIILRSSLILGPDAPLKRGCRKKLSSFLQFVETRLVEKAETDFFTDEYRSVVYVKDVVSVIHYFILSSLAGTSEAGVYNMGGADRVSRLDIATSVARHCGLDETFARGVARSSLPPGKVASPPDISMNVERLERTTGMRMLGLDAIVRESLSPGI